ncbi:plant-specific TFIIB-related protein PTF2-like [Silene latifolia]|uniref:plant-specific TFIIB-related protein PTF2-like n=1 Tax=Silene latifolia TaxID=37657 RepID=UPI003D76BD44
MAVCKRCKNKTLVTNDVTGDTVCSSCGVVQDFTNFHHQFGDGGGNFVTPGTTGSAHDYTYKDRKFYHSNNIIEDIAYHLDLLDRAWEVKDMVNKVTDGEYGLGNWFSVLVGACCYIVMRQKNKVLTIDGVCDVVGSDLYEMGRMVGRVVDFLGLELPEFDVVGLLERTIRMFSGFKEVDKEKVEVMVKHGNFVVQCCIKWWLTTGRRPGPVVVAVLFFVAELNGFKVRIEEVAKEVNVGIATCKLRYKELREALVEVAKGLPWGNDINLKNIMRHAPSVIKYMEMKSMGSSKKRGHGNGLGDFGDAHREDHKKTRSGNRLGEFDSNNDLRDLFDGDAGHKIDIGGSGVENGLQPDGEAHGCYSCNGDLKDLKASYENLAKLYSKFKAEFASNRITNRDEVHNYEDEHNDLDLHNEWWSGESELFEKLFLKQLEEKDVGLDALPPSYIRGCLAVKKRREKIGAAKMRINNIRFPSTDDGLCSGIESSSDMCVSENVIHHKKRKSKSRRTKKEEPHDIIDWEDFIIETLLLHKVKEEEIEKGHYKALLGLHVFKGSE